MEGGNPPVPSKFSSSKRNGSNTMHNFQSLFCAETGAGCGLVRHLAADGPGVFRHTSSCSRNLSGRGPSILPCKTVLSLKSPTGAFIAALRKREPLRARCFRQLARKYKGNFGKKREGWMLPALLTGADMQISILCPHILPA